MSKILMNISVLLAGIVISILPAHSIAQSENTMGVEDHGAFGRHEREGRRDEFLANNPEVAQRIQQRKQEMENRRAAFEERYPEAAAEMRTWVETDSDRRQQMREQLESRRAEFESKYPEAIAEMKAMREQGREEREARRAEMETRRSQFEEKYPQAATELRSMQEDLGRRGGGFRRGSGKGFPPGFDRQDPDI